MTNKEHKPDQVRLQISKADDDDDDDVCNLLTAQEQSGLRCAFFGC